MTLPSAFLDELHRTLPSVAIAQDAGTCARLSKDYYWYSPWLQESLKDKCADAIVSCQTEAEVVTVVRAAYAYRVPIVTRGLGTGNYGQAVPLEGGIVLDLAPMNQILQFENGGAIVQPGTKLIDIELAAREQGQELRMYPSTIAMSSIGGFVAGGSCGIGSINHGVLRDRGNVRRLRVITANDDPKILNLVGKDIDKVLHAYGTNGIITELDIPLTHRTDWRQMVVEFEGLDKAHTFCWAIGRSEGIHKRTISLLERSLVPYQKPLTKLASGDRHVVLLLVDPTDVDETRMLATEFGGSMSYEGGLYEADAPTISEATWNHTTLWAKAADDSYTYLQCAFAADPQKSWEQTLHLKDVFGEDWSVHAELIRFMGSINYWSLPVLRYRDREGLQAIMDECHAIGVGISNPHTYILEEGGHDAGNPVQLAFKYEADPQGILNPGKMKLFVPPEQVPTQPVKGTVS